jgi:ABC-type transporter Mla maintaining outer membrane lipid asymmetry ATPase subunit MlaF
VIVTHSRSCALTAGDRIGIFEQGRIAAVGAAEEMAASSDPRVRIYLGIDGESGAERADSRGAEQGAGATGR